MAKPYGYELILDMHGCDPKTFTRRIISDYFTSLCVAIDVEEGDLHFWDDVGVPEEECQTDPNTKGTSAVQFILTSSIVIHALDLLGAVYINVFSCKPFDSGVVESLSRDWFKASACHASRFERI